MKDNTNLRHADGSLLDTPELSKLDAINAGIQNGNITVQQAVYLERLDGALFEKELKFILDCNEHN